MPDSKDARKLRDILKDASTGKEADQSEVSAAMSRNMIMFLPFLTFGFASYVPSALALYFLSTSAFGYVQQKIILRQDAEEMAEISEENGQEETKPAKTTTKSTKTKPKKKKKSQAKKRRK